MGWELKDRDEELAKKSPPIKQPLLETSLITPWNLSPFLGQANAQMGEDSKQIQTKYTAALTCVTWGHAHTMSDPQPQPWGRRKNFSGKWPEACHWFEKA